jgi:hypothetical protein
MILLDLEWADGAGGAIEWREGCGGDGIDLIFVELAELIFLGVNGGIFAGAFAENEQV